jgi:hypothetical protein
MARLTRGTRYKFRPFDEARRFARKLGFSSRSEWRRYCASPQRPVDIPSNPQIAYRSEWKNWGDFLGTNNTKNSFLPFSEARPLARSLGFHTMAAYRAAAQDGALPLGLPKDPYAAYRNSGWQSSSDWLGTSHPSTHEKNRKKRSFTELLGFARSLGLRSKSDWFRYAKAGDRPADIPVNPADSYRGEGWQGWPHFLGTTNKKAGEVTYRDFIDGRGWARSQGLQSQDEWKALTKSGRLPPDIPANPWHVYRYRGWINIGDWLGKGDHHSKNRQWRNYEQAKDFVRTLGLPNGTEWNAYCKSGKLPADIPAMPGRVYKGSGWISMGNWLGTGAIASTQKRFLDHAEAREEVRALGFRSKTEYGKWARSDMRPPNIPALPSRTYARSGWRVWGDYLGIYRRWNKKSILAFVSSMVPVLDRLQPSELYAILRQNGCLNAIESLAEPSPLKRLVEVAFHQDKKGIEQSLRDLELEKFDDAEIQPSSDVPENDLITDTVVPLSDNDVGLPDLSPIGILSGLDDLERSVVLSDTETVEFLITKAVGRLWSRVLRSDDVDKDLADLKSHTRVHTAPASANVFSLSSTGRTVSLSLRATRSARKANPSYQTSCSG